MFSFWKSRAKSIIMNTVKDKKNVITFVCLITTYISFAFVYLLVSFSLETFPPVVLSFLRYFVAGLIFLFWAYFIRKERKLPSKNDWQIMLVVAFGMMVIKGGFLIYSEVYTPSGIVAVMLGSTPMWMVVIGWLFFGNKAPTAVTSVGLFVGFIGVIIIAVEAVLSDGKDDHIIKGIILTGISVLGGVLGSLYSKNKKTEVRIVTAFGFQMMVAALFFLMIAVFLGEFDSFTFENISFKSWCSFIGLVVFGSITGFSAYLWLLYNAPSGVSTSYTYVEPILAVIIGVVFGGEKLTVFIVLGCIFIAISVFIIITRRDLWHKEFF